MTISTSQSLLAQLPEVRGSYREQADLSKITWFQVGGPAELLFRPKDVEDLCHFLAHKSEDVPVQTIGVGSNLLVRDGGIEGVVIRLGRGFTDIRVVGDRVIAGAAALSFNVAMVAREHGIGGLEFLSGIPGTIGGALAMNAGAYGSDTSQILVSATAIDDRGGSHDLALEDMGYVYRGNTLPEGMIFVEGVFQGVMKDKEVISEEMDRIAKARQFTQPIKERTSGSTFKNPTDGSKKAWELIDEAGCRGLKIGGAMVSQLHCNFLINTGDASAVDIETLGETVRQKVKEKSGTSLTWEIQRIGNHPEGVG